MDDFTRTRIEQLSHHANADIKCIAQVLLEHEERLNSARSPEPREYMDKILQDGAHWAERVSGKRISKDGIERARSYLRK